MGNGEEDSEDEESGGEGTINYRGQIDESDWREFKHNVPRTTKLMEKVNELIREFNAANRNRDVEGGGENRNGNGNGSDNGGA